MELMSGYHYRPPGEFQAQINRTKAKNGGFPGCWTTQEGLVLLPQNMRDGHLLNSIAMTERRYIDKMGIPNIRSIATKVINGTYNNSYQDHHIREVVRSLRKSRTYINMLKEARDRGILE